MLRAAEGSCLGESSDMKQFYHEGKGQRLRTENRELRTDNYPSVHRVVLGDDPLAALVLGGDGEEFLVGAGLACTITTLAAVVKNGQPRRALPLRQLPGKQRMLRFRVADEVGVLLA